MAVGLIPHESIVFPLEGLMKEQLVAVAREVAIQLDWDVQYAGADQLVAYSKFRKASRNEKISLMLDNGIVTVTSESQGGQFIDWGRNKRNLNDFVAGYDHLRSSLSPDELHTKTVEFQQALTDGEGISAGQVERTENAQGVLSIFIPVKGYFVTPLLIDINILIFVFMLLSGANIMQPSSQMLLAWGANFRPYTLDGQAWRLLTNCFLHIGILHLLFNMYALMYIGVLLEPRLGSRRFAITYLLTGIVASVASVYWHAMNISAGASGAIFGMYGVFLAMLTTSLIEKSVRKALLISISIFVIYNLANGLKGGIDNAAHIGGLLSGIVLGYSFYPGLSGSLNTKWNYGLPLALVAILLAFSSWVYVRIPSDLIQYNKRMESFVVAESKALEIFKLPDSTPKDQLLSAIKDQGLFYWNQNRNLMDSLDRLDLPAEIHTKNQKLQLYCDLRIKSYEVIYKSVDEKSDAYNDQIRAYVKSIDSLIRTLKNN